MCPRIVPAEDFASESSHLKPPLLEDFRKVTTNLAEHSLDATQQKPLRYPLRNSFLSDAN